MGKGGSDVVLKPVIYLTKKDLPVHNKIISKN